MIYAALSSQALIGKDIKIVLETAIAAGAQGVEWTDDGFIRPGASIVAQETMISTLRAGLCTVSYATLYRACVHDPAAFRLALATAHELNSPILRLWSAPRGSSSEADAGAFVAAARSLGDEAGELGVTLCFGLSRDSVLDSCVRAATLLDRIDHPFVKLAWEPSRGFSFDDSMEALSTAAGRIGLVIVRSDDLDGSDGALGDCSEEWYEYLDAYDEQGDSPDMARAVIIRSITDGDISRLASDIRSIRSWAETLRRYHRRRVY